MTNAFVDDIVPSVAKMQLEELTVKHTDIQIASDLKLWNEYIAPGAEMDEEKFNMLTMQERVFIVRDCFGMEPVLTWVTITMDDTSMTCAEINLNGLVWWSTPDLVDNICVNALVYERIADALANGEMDGVVHTDDQTFGWGIE